MLPRMDCLHSYTSPATARWCQQLTVRPVAPAGFEPANLSLFRRALLRELSYRAKCTRRCEVDQMSMAISWAQLRCSQRYHVLS